MAPQHRQALDVARRQWANIAIRLHGKAAKKVQQDLSNHQSTKSLFLFKYTSGVRRTCRSIVENKFFEVAIIITILLNCVSLAAIDPTEDPDDPSKFTQAQELAEYVFLGIFTVEMVLKVIASGFVFCGPLSYLRNKWNVLDFVIVLVGLIGIIIENTGSSVTDVKALRAFRVLRPLRLISSLPSLQIVLNSILLSIPALADVGLLLVFIIVIFAIIGLEFYRGKLNNQCFSQVPGDSPLQNCSVVEVMMNNITQCIPFPALSDVYSVMGNRTYVATDDSDTCGARTFQCGEVTDRCLFGSSPNQNVTSFDHGGIAILTVFQIVTLEGWTDILYAVNQAVAAADINWLFFFLLVLIGSFFVINLVLGVLSGQFTRAGEHLKTTHMHFVQRRKLRTNFDINSLQCWLQYANHMDPTTPDASQLPEHMTLYRRERFEKFDSKLAMQEHEKQFMHALQVQKEQEMERLLKPRGEGGDADDDDDDRVETSAELQDSLAAEAQRDKHLLSTFVMGVSLPSGRRDFVDVEGCDTFTQIRKSLVAKFTESEGDCAKYLHTYKFVHPKDGHILTDTTLLKNGGVRLITLAEYNEIQAMDAHNGKALMKPSTIQMLSTLGGVVKSRGFNLAILLLVLANTVTLSLSIDNSGRNGSAAAYDIVEVVFLSIFVLEIILKWAGLGRKVYFESRFNTFDFIVVIAGVIELLVVHYSGLRSVGLSSLRSLRLLRFFRELRSYWEVVNDFVVSLIRSTASILSLLLLMFIFMVIASLLGMQLFGGRFDFNGENSRANFDDFFTAFLTIFSVVTGEDWNSVMYDGIAAYGGINDNGWIAVVFFCLVVVIGTFVLLNVFLAIAVKTLDDAQNLKDLREKHQEKWKDQHLNDNLDEDDREELRAHRSYANPLVGAKERQKEKQEEEDAVLRDERGIPLRKTLTRTITTNVSLFCLTSKNSFRRFCWNIEADRRFENLILVLILISSALLAAEDPINPDAQINKDLNTADIVFTTIFTLEMVLKIVSLGFLPYVKDPWNDLDAVVVIASIVSLSIQSDNASAVRILRVFRVLRPLRAIKRAPGLRKVVSCMIKSIKTIGNVFIITFLLTFIFSVIGVSSFHGCFGRCNDGSVANLTQCDGNFTVVDEFGLNTTLQREWSTPYFNFDNVPRGLMTLFAVSTLEGWIGIMNDAIDCVAPDVQPVRNHNPFAAVFFVVYIILVAFFMLNIFVGYVIVTFSEEGESYDSVAGLDKNQRKCLLYCLQANPTPIFEPTYNIQKPMYHFVTSKVFEWFIMGVIIANTFVLLLAYEGMPQHYEDNLALCNVIFTTVFTVEAVLKLFALNPTSYFEDDWNLFDFVIVVGSLADIVISEMATEGETGVSVGFLRLFRIARLVKLVNRGESMKRLLWTFYKSFQSLPYVAALILMLFFVYAVIGVQIFANVGFREDGEINAHNNFKSFWSALLLLFRCSTGENWQNIMRDAVLGPDDCDAYRAVNPNGTCGSEFAVPYFTSFVVLCSFLILNLFVAVIIDNFEYLTQDRSKLGEHNLPAFVDAWSRYDPNCTYSIPHESLLELLKTEEPPLGFGKSCPARRSFAKMMRLSIPLNLDGTVEFRSSLLAVVRSQLDIFMSGGWEESNQALRDVLVELYALTDKELDALLPRSSRTGVHVGMLYAVYLLQSVFREKRRLRVDSENLLYEPQQLQRHLALSPRPRFSADLLPPAQLEDSPRQPRRHLPRLPHVNPQTTPTIQQFLLEDGEDEEDV